MKIKLRECVKKDSLRCPNCGSGDIHCIADNTLSFGEGFDPPLQMEGGDTALSSGPYVFLPKLLLWGCGDCDDQAISIVVTMAEGKNVSREWIENHLYYVGQSGGCTTLCVNTSDPQYPRQWLVRIESKDDVLVVEHMFGLYLALHDMASEGHTIKRDSGDEAWYDAATLVTRMWPIITSMRQNMISTKESPAIEAPTPMRELVH